MTQTGGDSSRWLTPLTEPRQLWVVGFGGSGGNWISRLLMDALDIYDAATDGPSKPYIFGKLNWTLERPPGGKVCFIYRDPRDMIVSMMHFWRLSSIDKVLYPEDQPDLLPTLVDYYQAWLMTLEPEATTRYEWLLGDTKKELSRLLDTLMIQYDPDRIDGVVERQTFATSKNTMEASGNDHRAWGMQYGRSGRWREFLNQDQGFKIDYWLGDWMFRMGYETEADWWSGLPE